MRTPLQKIEDMQRVLWILYNKSIENDIKKRMIGLTFGKGYILNDKVKNYGISLAKKKRK